MMVKPRLPGLNLATRLFLNVVAELPCESEMKFSPYLTMEIGKK